MKTKNFSFKSIKDVLSRDEMRVIMAGSGGGSGENSCDNFTCPVAGKNCARNTSLECVCNDGETVFKC